MWAQPNLIVDASLLNSYFSFHLQVPKEWKLDSDWDGETKNPQISSHLRSFPSKWRAAVSHQDPVHTVKIVDHFTIERTECGDTDSKGQVDQWFIDLLVPFVTLFRKRFEEMKSRTTLFTSLLLSTIFLQSEMLTNLLARDLKDLGMGKYEPSLFLSLIISKIYIHYRL